MSHVQQNEVGGKQLLLKVCQEFTGIDVSSGDTALDIGTNHGVLVGDLACVTDLGDGTGDTGLDTLLTGGGKKFYFVIDVGTDDSITLSESRSTDDAVSIAAASQGLKVDIYRNLGGIRSKSMGFSSEGIDITSQDSDEWNKILDGAGVRSFEVSGSGVYTNEDVFQDLRARAMLNELSNLMLIDVKVDRIYEGLFKISSLELSGDYDSESSYSMSATSSGEVKVYKLVADEVVEEGVSEA